MPHATQMPAFISQAWTGKAVGKDYVCRLKRSLHATVATGRTIRIRVTSNCRSCEKLVRQAGKSWSHSCRAHAGFLSCVPAAVLLAEAAWAV